MLGLLEEWVFRLNLVSLGTARGSRPDVTAGTKAFVDCVPLEKHVLFHPPLIDEECSHHYRVDEDRDRQDDRH